MSIEVRNISKSFGSFQALGDVSLRIEADELVALLGPSGSGKTTLLRIIAGLETPDAGSGPILFHDQDVAKQRVYDRGVGFVFQHYALFRHMSVFENIAFGLRVRPRKTRPSNPTIKKKVDELLELIQLGSVSHRFPHQLSGGQRQRVALARALAVEPQILLLDEPFGALDAKVRVELRAWLRRLHNEIHLTSVFVTHDQDEALELADRVAVMSAGKIEQFGTPDDVFHKPATEFVMNFLGTVNQFRGRLDEARGKVQIGTHEFDSDVIVYGATDATVETSTSATPVFVRPHDLELTRMPKKGELSIPAAVLRVHSAGATVRVEMITETSDAILAEISHQEFRELKLEEQCRVFVTPRNMRVFG